MEGKFRIIKISNGYILMPYGGDHCITVWDEAKFFSQKQLDTMGNFITEEPKENKGTP